MEEIRRPREESRRTRAHRNLRQVHRPQDAYKSIAEAFVHAGAANNVGVDLIWVRAEDVERDGAEKHLSDVTGLLVAPGFGERGIEGKIKAVQYVRTHGIPFFGICLGLQCAVIEFARNVCGLDHANSTEFKQGDQNVIDMMVEQKKVKDYGGTMRLGAYPCRLEKRNEGPQGVQGRPDPGTSPSPVRGEQRIQGDAAEATA